MPGNQSNPKGLPANSVLRFDVEVVSAQAAPQAQAAPAPPTK